jgi:hypothetical protein
MATKTTIEDRYERYFAEKLWEMIPEIYRHEDGLETNPNPHVLRSLVEILAGQAAHLRRSQDQLWDDQFIELSNDWAIPYIADLVGTRLISALNKRGYRIDVAKTIYYRRRKGTPRILEELINDIGDWEGKLVEQFKRLARARHGLDPKPQPYAGRFSGTMPGGWADLRHPRVSELTDSPFDEFFHTTDVRQHRGYTGRYNIPKLAFHLYKLDVFEVKEVTPFFRKDGHGFTFDPSGRDIPIFGKRSRTKDWEQWHSALEWEIPAPIRCRLLAHAEYHITHIAIDELVKNHGLSPANALALKACIGWHFANETRLLTALNACVPTLSPIENQAFYAPLLNSLVKDCGKSALYPASVSVFHQNTLVDSAKMTAANLKNWALPAIDKQVAIDPERGRFFFLPPPSVLETDVTASYHYGFAARIGAGTYKRLGIETLTPNITNGGELTDALINPNGKTQIGDNKTYSPIASKTGIENMDVEAVDEKRPFLKLDADWELTASGTAGIKKKITLEGLWIGSAGDKKCEIILRGHFDEVVIRHCTLDPGGTTNILNETLHPVPIIVEGTVEKLWIDESIVAPIMTRNNGIIENLIVCDSIIQSTNLAMAALSISGGKMVHLERVTVFGDLKVHRLEATETLITGIATVQDTQTGCFRFSAAPAPPISRLPRPYESFLFTQDNNHWFSSRIFGQPDYAVLSETAPPEILRGGENGVEMGVFNSLINAIKQDNLTTKIEEYMPFGLVPIFINQKIR